MFLNAATIILARTAFGKHSKSGPMNKITKKRTTAPNTALNFVNAKIGFIFDFYFKG